MIISKDAFAKSLDPLALNRSFQSNNVDEEDINFWKEKGYFIFKNLISNEKVDAYNEIISYERSLMDDGKNEFGFGDRIGQLHQKSKQLLEILNTEKLLNFIRVTLDDEPCVFGSLNFDRGTEQGVHVDSLFFYPEPHYSMVGVWVALEDISLDSGPLFYVSESHKLPFYFSNQLCTKYPEMANKIKNAREGVIEKGSASGEFGNLWCKDLSE